MCVPNRALCAACYLSLPPREGKSRVPICCILKRSLVYIGERIWGSRFQNSPLDLSVDLLTRRFKRGYLTSEQVPNVLVLSFRYRARKLGVGVG